MSFASSGTGTYVFRLTANDGTNAPFDEVTFTVNPAPAETNYAIDFDGANDYVTLRKQRCPRPVRSSRSRPGSAGTASAITNSTGSGGVTAVPLIAKGRNETDNGVVDMNYYFGINAGQRPGRRLRGRGWGRPPSA